MEHKITWRNFDPSAVDKEHLEVKLDKIKKLMTGLVGKQEIWIEAEHSTHHKKGPVTTVIIDVPLKNKSLRAEGNAGSFIGALDQAVTELTIELTKYKDKMIIGKRRELRKLKKNLRV